MTRRLPKTLFQRELFRIMPNAPIDPMSSMSATDTVVTKTVLNRFCTTGRVVNTSM